MTESKEESPGNDDRATVTVATPEVTPEAADRIFEALERTGAVRVVKEKDDDAPRT